MTTLVAAWTFGPATVSAHVPILERIAALDRAIVAKPGDAALILKRGELHRLHSDWPAALADYAAAERLEPENPLLSLYRGRMWHEAGEPGRARPLLDRFLAQRPDHANALVIRSRVLGLLGEPVTAAADLTRAIALLDHVTPEIYLERARHLRSAGSGRIGQALAGLDDGIARLGPLVSLVGLAVELEASAGRYPAAVARIDTLSHRVAHGPAWLQRRGDLLRRAGEDHAARDAYAAALKIIVSYPPARRTTPTIARREHGLRAALENLAVTP